MVNAVKRLINAIVPVLFVAAGIALIVMGFNSVKLRKEYVPVTAVVSNIVRIDDTERSYHNDVYVKYTADGRQYESVLGGVQSNWSVGDEVAVLYDPADPSVVVSAGQSSTMMFITGGIAIVLGLAGAMILFVRK